MRQRLIILVAMTMLSGCIVTVVAIIGNSIHVSALGKVLDAAGKGNAVTVQNMASKENVQAIIVNKNPAHITMGGI